MFPADEDDTDEDVAALLDGSLAVPCSTYCMLGSRALPKRIAAKTEASHGEICENLFFLGRPPLLECAVTTQEPSSMPFQAAWPMILPRMTAADATSIAFVKVLYT